jgi:putative oxidoreductase
MMLTHGYPKLMRLLEGNIKFADPKGLGQPLSLFLAMFAEFFGSILLLIGFQSRITAFLLAFTMGVAGFVYHAGDDFGSKEKSFLYFVIFLVLLILGPGKCK